MTMGQFQSSNKPKTEGELCLDVIHGNDFLIKKLEIFKNLKLEEKPNSKEMAQYP